MNKVCLAWCWSIRLYSLDLFYFIYLVVWAALVVVAAVRGKFLANVWATRSGKTSVASLNILTGLASRFILPHETASSGLAPESLLLYFKANISLLCYVYIYTYNIFATNLLVHTRHIRSPCWWTQRSRLHFATSTTHTHTQLYDSSFV